MLQNVEKFTPCNNLVIQTNACKCVETYLARFKLRDVSEIKERKEIIY